MLLDLFPDLFNYVMYFVADQAFDLTGNALMTPPCTVENGHHLRCILRGLLRVGDVCPQLRAQMPWKKIMLQVLEMAATNRRVRKSPFLSHLIDRESEYCTRAQLLRLSHQYRDYVLAPQRLSDLYCHYVIRYVALSGSRYGQVPLHRMMAAERLRIYTRDKDEARRKKWAERPAKRQCTVKDVTQ